MGVISRFVDPYIIEEVWHPGEATWVHRVYHPLRYESVLLNATILLPAGVLNDGASVPRMLPGAYALFGNTVWAPAAIHDLLYQTHMVESRELADDIFHEAILARGGYAKAHAEAMYHGVRFGGQSSWESGLGRFERLGNKRRLGGPIILPIGTVIPPWAFDEAA